MRTVMPPQSVRPRLMLLPILLGVLVVSAFLAGSSTPADGYLRTGAVCANERAPAKNVVKPRTAPSCVNCKAPLLNAPLARADHAAPATSLVALPPAA